MGKGNRKILWKMPPSYPPGPLSGPERGNRTKESLGWPYMNEPELFEHIWGTAHSGQSPPPWLLALAVRHPSREYKPMSPVRCPVCGANAVGSPYPDRDVQFIKCPACGSFDVPKTTDLLILRELPAAQRAVLSFWLRHEARGKTPLVLTDELTKRLIKEKKLPVPDKQEENLIQIVGKTLESGEPHLAVDLRYLASEIGAPSERDLRELVAHLLEKGVLNGIRNVLMVRSGEAIGVLLGLTPDGFRRYRELQANLAPSNHGRSAKVFLSHAASDEHIALVLKAEIERRLTGVKVFCSSDPTDLPPGSKWSPKIQRALQG